MPVLMKKNKRNSKATIKKIKKITRKGKCVAYSALEMLWDRNKQIKKTSINHIITKDNETFRESERPFPLLYILPPKHRTLNSITIGNRANSKLKGLVKPPTNSILNSLAWNGMTQATDGCVFSVKNQTCKHGKKSIIKLDDVDEIGSNKEDIMPMSDVQIKKINDNIRFTKIENKRIKFLGKKPRIQLSAIEEINSMNPDDLVCE